MQRLMHAGALGLIHIWRSAESALHEETVGPVWGTPVPDDAPRYPTIPVISINLQDGTRLRAQLETDTLRADITTLLHEHVALLIAGGGTTRQQRGVCAALIPLRLLARGHNR